MSYDELVGEYHAALALCTRIEARMFDCEPGSDRGAELYRTLERVSATASELRLTIRNHPDSPPQG